MLTQFPFRPRYDVVIIGARCAGAATALLLARRGAKVLLVDRQDYGTDTMSTHALMRTGVLQLHRWGLLNSVMAEDTPEVRTTTFHYGSEQLVIAMKEEHGFAYLCAPRRTVLDRILVDAARAAGADVRHNVVLSSLHFGAENRVTGASLRNSAGHEVAVSCEMVIGADGRQSTVAKLVNAETLSESKSASGSVYGYFEALHRDGFHWHFANQAAASIIPTNASRHCVVASVPDWAFSDVFRGDVEAGFLRVLALNSQQLHDDVRNARLVGRFRGFPGRRGFFRQAHGAGWALVGDAGYFKDPLTAHGITDSLRDAELLARAVCDARPQAFHTYQDMRDALSKKLFDITDAIASFHWTVDEVKALHSDLSTAMRAETRHMADLSRPDPVAA
jgi:2-polyprenyl-6-methoxyphenol hydroxylase-like FAD-dependent oxidoreductase